jgi:hypothetical protein
MSFILDYLRRCFVTAETFNARLANGNGRVVTIIDVIFLQTLY